MTMGTTATTRELIQCTELFREWFSLIDTRGEGFFQFEELINFLSALGGDIKATPSYCMHLCNISASYVTSYCMHLCNITVPHKE